jgi:hypothetical protein
MTPETKEKFSRVCCEVIDLNWWIGIEEDANGERKEI